MEAAAHRPGFAGRQGELAHLTQLWEASRAGRGTAVLLVGDAGMGKSALTETFAATRTDARVVWGRAWEAGGAPPFWPWLQALRALARQRGEQVHGLAPERRGSLPPDEARFAMLDATVHALLDAAAERPTLLVLEDLHAADEASVALLELVVDAARQVPLMVVATTRQRELAEAHGRAAERLQRSATRLDLGPLDGLLVQQVLSVWPIILPITTPDHAIRSPPRSQTDHCDRDR